MFILRRWQSKTALVVTLGMATASIAPFTLSAAFAATPPHRTETSYAIAQLFPSDPTTQRVAIPAGTRIPVRYTQAEKIVVAPNETLPLTLVVDRNIRSTSGKLLIGAGSRVQGRLTPVDGGSQFIAQDLILTNGTRLPIRASSRVITTRQEVRPGVNTDAILKGAAIGAGAATIISGITGTKRITLGKILLGGGAGALGGLLLGRQRDEVIAIDANQDLDLTLDSSLALR